MLNIYHNFKNINVFHRNSSQIIAIHYLLFIDVCTRIRHCSTVFSRILNCFTLKCNKRINLLFLANFSTALRNTSIYLNWRSLLTIVSELYAPNLSVKSEINLSHKIQTPVLLGLHNVYSLHDYLLSLNINITHPVRFDIFGDIDARTGAKIFNTQERIQW